MTEDELLEYYDFLCTVAIALKLADKSKSNGQIVKETCHRIHEGGRYNSNRHIVAAMKKAKVTPAPKVWEVFKPSITEYCKEIDRKFDFVEEKLSEA